MVFFKPFLLCVLSSDAVVRQLAASVAERLFANHREAFDTFEGRRHFGAQDLRRELWSKR